MFEREIYDCRWDYVPPMKSDAEYEVEMQSKDSEVKSEELKEESEAGK